VIPDEASSVGVVEPAQGALFEASFAQSPPGSTATSQLGAEPVEGDSEDGYRGATACSVVGITYRQLDYWARTKLVEASIRQATGSGSQRLYSFRDILVLKVVKRLLDAGVSLQNIRVAVEQLRRRGAGDLAEITLISDGTTVYECRSPEEIVDLLQGGQGVFGIAVGGAFRELEGELAMLPTAGEAAIPAQSGGLEPALVDELAVRRLRRAA
jgi:DNA-binding transcriptional MerR regulator